MLNFKECRLFDFDFGIGTGLFIGWMNECEVQILS